MTQEELAVDPDLEPDADVSEGEELSEQEKIMARLKEAILVEREELGPLRLKLTITVPRETVDERMGEQFVELQKDAVVPGFRKGRAPMKLIEKRFAGDVGDQLKSQLIGSGYMAAIEKEGLKPLGEPRIWVRVKEERTGEDNKPRLVETDKLVSVEKALETLELPKDKPLTFACELELKPEFELPALEGIPINKPTLTITDADVDEEIRRIRLSYGRYEPVEGGAVQPHDLLYADVKVEVDGDIIHSSENSELFARDGYHAGLILKGLGAALVGKNLNETAVVESTIPDDHENLAARGKTAKVSITIREIKRLEPHPLDSAFLQMIGAESESELRSTVRSAIESEIDRVVKAGLRSQMADYLVKNVDVQIPEGLSQRQMQRTVARRMMELLQSGVPEAEVAKAADEMRVQAKDQAIRDLKLLFILEKIAEQREIEVGEEQVNAAISTIARRTNKRFDRVRDELSKGDGLLALYMSIRDQMVLDALLETASITKTEGPKT